MGFQSNKTLKANKYWISDKFCASSLRQLVKNFRLKSVDPRAVNDLGSSLPFRQDRKYLLKAKVGAKRLSSTMRHRQGSFVALRWHFRWVQGDQYALRKIDFPWTVAAHISSSLQMDPHLQ